MIDRKCGIRLEFCIGIQYNYHLPQHSETAKECTVVLMITNKTVVVVQGLVHTNTHYAFIKQMNQ